jgi:F420-dependent oxidoreductase-like protein
LNLPSPCVVVLVGPGASGKSTWAAENFRPDLIVSSDRLRALVGSSEDDIAASADAFDLLETVVGARLRRRLSTVIDTQGLDATRRRGWIEAAKQSGMPCVAVTFDTPPEECRARNRARPRPLPSAVLTAQLREWQGVREVVGAEGFDDIVRAGPTRIVPPVFVGAVEAGRRQAEAPAQVRFGLHLGSFTFGPGRADLRASMRRVGTAAEEARFDAVYVMDHFRQIPQVGRPWEDFLESYTALAYLAACTETVRLGTLVTGVTYRNPAHLGKIIATLDVLSGGRALCGLGLGWHHEEHVAYGWEFPSVGDRYALLEDTLRLLPVLWGPGAPAFEGDRIVVPEAMCYPRPLQDHIPIIVGGGGERRTLRLAARYADAANVLGDLDTVRRKAEVLRQHCAREGRPPNQVQLSHMSTVLVGADDRHVGEVLDRIRPRRADPAVFARSVHAGTVDDHIGRVRELAEAGVGEVVVRLPDPSDTAVMEQMAKVISAFR